MADWGPVFVAVVLFLLLTPGLLVQIPGSGRCVEFGNFRTSGVSILVHSFLYFALICIFYFVVGIHLYLGQLSCSFIQQMVHFLTTFAYCLFLYLRLHLNYDICVYSPLVQYLIILITTKLFYLLKNYQQQSLTQSLSIWLK